MNNNFKSSAYFITLISCITAILPACGSLPPSISNLGAMDTGTQVSQAQMDSLTDKQAKEANVIAVVGQPNRKAQVGSKEIWYYDYTHIGQAYIGVNISEVSVFEFNAAGLLLSHYKTTGPNGASSNPLLKAAGQ